MTIEQIAELNKIAKAMVAPGKGILAADESMPTIEKRFKALGIENTEDNRRAYREMLFTTPGIEEFLGGVILFDETIRQKSSDGRLFAEVLREKEILPGIKVDQGTEPMPDSTDEKITKGLEGLPERFTEYANMGAKFAKWRAVFTIGKSIPTDENIQENARRLAQYAYDSQNAGIVPIVEPEVLLDGDHTIQRCEEVTTKTLKALFEELERKGVVLQGIILKTNMVLSGKDCSTQASASEVAEATLRTLKATVPSEVPGVAFLSGGQDDILATARLNEINKIGGFPWQVTFSYSRGLQNLPMKTWAGKAENVEAAKKVFYQRAKLNSLARQGKYSEELEK